jgi:PAS domain S-box-containing protein
MFGYSIPEWFSQPDFWFKIIHPDDLERVQQEHWRTNQSREPFDMEYRMLAKDDRVVWVRDRAVITHDEHGTPLCWVGTFEDITQHKIAEETLRQEKIRNEALLQLYQMSDKPLKDLADYFLSAAIKITQSQIGFLGFIHDDKATMTVYAWSKEVLENCQMQDQPLEFSLENGGLWAEALRQRKPFILNDYHADHPHKKGLPLGHLPINNFLGVPLNDGERIVMLVGLSNKPTAYTAEDAHQLTLMMSGLWTILQRKRAEEALQERLLKLISPDTQLRSVTLEDLFDIQELQVIQVAFSEATGVASLITDGVGRPITQPSHFCRLCKDIIRKTDIGLQNCMAFDAEIGNQSEQEDKLFTCNSGLWNSSTPIMVGNRHIANWVIGQVLDETANEENLLSYAEVIGANKDEYRQALREVPRMPAEKFKKISAALHLIAKQLSRLAAQNIQQAQVIAERQKVEEALAQERTILRTLINQIPDAIYVKDKYARKTLSNATDLFFMGLKEEAEVLGKTDFDFFPREIAEQFYADDMRVLQQGEAVINKEEVTQDIHGEKRYLLTTKIPIRDKEGNIIRLVGVGRDITERKKAEDALIRERNLLRDLIINAPDTIFIKDRQSRFVLCNPTLAKRHGFNNPDDLIGKTDFDIHEQALAAQFFAEEQHVMETGEPFFNREQCYRDGVTGELRWVSSTKVPWRNEKGEIIGVIGINRDITEQKKTEELIQRERNLLRALINSAIDQVFVKDTQGCFVLCNPAAVKSLGKNSLEEVIGKTDFDFFPKDLAERFYAEEQLIIQSAQPLVNREAKITDEDGNVRWISTNKVSWRNEYGEIIGLVGINRDITEQKLAQEALSRERHLLQAIVNGTPDHIYVKDRNSRFILCNPATAYAMGLSDPSQL